MEILLQEPVLLIIIIAAFVFVNIWIIRYVFKIHAIIRELKMINRLLIIIAKHNSNKEQLKEIVEIYSHKDEIDEKYLIKDL